MGHPRMPVAPPAVHSDNLQRSWHRRLSAKMSKQWIFQSGEAAPKLHAVTYESSTPVAQLFWHHGLTEHCGRYDESVLCRLIRSPDAERS
jgi:hypothetical protein